MLTAVNPAASIASAMVCMDADDRAMPCRRITHSPATAAELQHMAKTKNSVRNSGVYKSRRLYLLVLPLA